MREGTEHKMATCAFHQLVDIEQVQLLLQSHHALTGMTYAILDTDENILVAVGWQDICVRFHRVNPVSCASCRESDAYIKTHLRDSLGGLLEYRCKNGMIDVAMPIIIEGEHLATFFTGQFFYEDDRPDTAFFRGQAESFGFDPEMYLAALERVPVLSRETVRSNMLFMYEMVKVLAKVGLANLKLEREIEEHKRTEKMLISREQEYRTLAENSPDNIIRHDRDCRAVYLNSMLMRTLNIEPGRFLGKTPVEALGEMFRGYEDAIRRVLETGVPDELELEYPSPSGELSIHNIRFTAERDPSGDITGVLAYGREITERRRMEEELHQREQAFRGLAENTRDLIFRYDRNFRRIYVNPAVVRFFGKPVESLLGKTPDEAMVLDAVNNAEHMRCIGEVLASGRSMECELAFEAPDGQKHHFLSGYAPEWGQDGNVASVLLTSRDITERKLSEDKLKESEFFFRESQRSASIGSYKIDFTSGHWESSEVLDTIFGIDKGYARTLQGWLVLVHPDDRNGMERYLKEEVIAKKQPFSKEYRIIRHDDRAMRWVHGLGQVNVDGNGNVVSMFGTVQDITERKRMEEAHQNLEKQLLHTQKLESLGVLAGGIAHDFNNILVSIIGNADLALMKLSPESPATSNLRKIEQAASRAADLAKQMLAYSGKGKFVIEPTDLNRVLEEMLHMLEVSISKKITLRLNLARQLPAIEADITQIHQVIMNLIINASEAIGEDDGVITITTGSEDCDEAYLSGIAPSQHLPKGTYVALEITDTGCGMDQDTIAKIFDPFFTTKFTGRGLGMAAVHGIIKGHKGAINVYSERDRGTIFKVLLPASDLPESTQPVTVTETERTSFGTVLLVDDEEDIRNVGGSMLEALGFETVTAIDGFHALEIFKRNSSINIVILDLTMPRMDGEQTFYELLKLNPDVKVIMSSGYNEQEVTQKFIGKGLAGFIQKPYRLSALRKVLDSM